MFTLLTPIFGRKAPQPHKIASRATRPLRPRLECETLEDRVVPNISWWQSPFQVNTTACLNQYESANASSWSGNRYVVVWTNRCTILPGDIRAQLYNSGGYTVGPELLVSASPFLDHEPAVAMNLDGNFVVVWTRDTPEGKDVLGRLYDSNGNPTTAELPIAATRFQDEYDPSVAMDRRGNFVVSYTMGNPHQNLNVRAQMYRFNGAWIQQLTVAATGLDEHRSSVARAADGDFAIAYQKDENGGDIHVVRYDDQGNLLQDQAIDSTPRLDAHPSVSMDDDSNLVVVYQAFVGLEWEVKATRFRWAWEPEFDVTPEVGFHAERPVVALDRSNGPLDDIFVVAFEMRDPQGPYPSIGVRDVSAFDCLGPLILAAEFADQPAISMDTSELFSGTHYFLLSWTFPHSSSGQDTNVFAQWGSSDGVFACGLAAFLPSPTAPGLGREPAPLPGPACGTVPGTVATSSREAAHGDRLLAVTEGLDHLVALSRSKQEPRGTAEELWLALIQTDHLLAEKSLFSLNQQSAQLG